MVDWVAQRDQGLELILSTIQTQGFTLEEHPSLNTGASNYDERIAIERQRDIFVSQDGKYFLISFHTAPMGTEDFLGKLIAASKMGITLVPVLRKSMESKIFGGDVPVALDYDGFFFKRTGRRQSIKMDETWKSGVIDTTTILEREMISAATMNMIPYLQLEDNQGHNNALRLYATERVEVGYLGLGTAWAWALGDDHLSARFRLTVPLNPVPSESYKPIQLYISQKERNAIVERFRTVSEKPRISPKLSALVDELEKLEVINSGILTPTIMSYKNGFPLLYTALRHSKIHNNHDTITLLNAAISRRKGSLKSPNPILEYEHRNLRYHENEISQFIAL